MKRFCMVFEIETEKIGADLQDLLCNALYVLQNEGLVDPKWSIEELNDVMESGWVQSEVRK